ncbi:MAG: hypothetical protein IKH25_06790 [Muribaculaceae bacterium]|nr:hypothetical protein [Muribaculaceae bacterium]
MVLPAHIFKLIEKHCGRAVTRSADCEFIALDIESMTGEHIGVNTIKRLMGFINDEREPRKSTLDIIARYLGCNTWEEMMGREDSLMSSTFVPGKRKEVMVRDLEVGKRIRISYRPNRVVTIEYQGNYHFTVIESINGKLEVGDMLTLTHIIYQYPLLVSEVIRDGHSLGAFTAGDPYGITYSFIKS